MARQLASQFQFEKCTRDGRGRKTAFTDQVVEIDGRRRQERKKPLAFGIRRFGGMIEYAPWLEEGAVGGSKGLSQCFEHVRGRGDERRSLADEAVRSFGAGIERRAGHRE